ncbi:arylsulfatase B [Rhodopirellula maiorica SM1]|uniref:Arylsulfatase B n=1 Tax=Rhodopirellula maiorica SM1 TaxID=1265738 RepID=M5RND2_9BACT|nr:arylsulfatase B [Rhodopirellula maiorica SM1]
MISSLDVLPTFMAAAGADLLPLKPAPSHEDKRNRRRAEAKYGAYDGINLLPHLRGESDAAARTLFWRLQGQTAVRDGEDKLITLSHRPAQLFQVDSDLAEADDRSRAERSRAEQLYQILGEWEASLATVPLWGSSPTWNAESAKHYDQWGVRTEPR